MPSSRYNFKIGQRPPIFTMGLVRVKSAYIREIFATCDFSPQKPLDIEYQPLNWYPTDRYLSNKNGHFFQFLEKFQFYFWIVKIIYHDLSILTTLFKLHPTTIWSFIATSSSPEKILSIFTIYNWYWRFDEANFHSRIKNHDHSWVKLVSHKSFPFASAPSFVPVISNRPSSCLILKYNPRENSEFRRIVTVSRIGLSSAYWLDCIRLANWLS